MNTHPNNKAMQKKARKTAKRVASRRKIVPRGTARATRRRAIGQTKAAS